MPVTEHELSGVYDGDVVSASGEKIGSVGQIYLDDQSGEPTFVTANTGLFGMSQSFVPLRGARVENGNVVVDFDKTTVKDAPRIDDDGSLSPAEEDQLYAYYGMGTTDVDTADYGTTDQTPEPGYAQAAGTDSRSGDSRFDRNDDGRVDSGPDGRTSDSGDAVAREGSGGYGALGDASGTGDNLTTPDAPPADRHRDRVDHDRDSNASAPLTENSVPRSGGGRLRKWVMTEYEPVKSEEVYVEGSGQPGERPTR
jgi:sporulation protein YlmC with PRC-barrel domain